MGRDRTDGRDGVRVDRELVPFAYPFGGAIGFVAGSLLALVGIGYATIAWRLRRGEYRVWQVAVILPVVHTVGLNTLDLIRYGSIPSEDYPFMGASLIMVVLLLLLQSTRRFFPQSTQTGGAERTVIGGEQ